ncbi:unnamed protein product, partial [Closterium sp. NIES-54]
MLLLRLATAVPCATACGAASGSPCAAGCGAAASGAAVCCSAAGSAPCHRSLSLLCSPSTLLPSLPPSSLSLIPSNLSFSLPISPPSPPFPLLFPLTNLPQFPLHSSPATTLRLPILYPRLCSTTVLPCSALISPRWRRFLGEARAPLVVRSQRCSKLAWSGVGWGEKGWRRGGLERGVGDGKVVSNPHPALRLPLPALRLPLPALRLPLPALHVVGTFPSLHCTAGSALV